MNVATFPPASLPAQLAELRRESADRTGSRDEMDLAAKRATRVEIAHRNNALDGAIATLQRLVDAQARGEPGRGELVDALRKLKTAVENSHNVEESGAELADAHAHAEAVLAKVPS